MEAAEETLLFKLEGNTHFRLDTLKVGEIRELNLLTV